MRHWYPTQARARDLGEEIAKLERMSALFSDKTFESLKFVSEKLTQAQSRSDFPRHQLPRWVWLASVLRLHAPAKNLIAAKSGAALLFCTNLLDSPQLKESGIQDLNWVLDATVGNLTEHLGPAELRECLSSDELLRIYERLRQLCDCPCTSTMSS